MCACIVLFFYRYMCIEATSKCLTRFSLLSFSTNSLFLIADCGSSNHFTWLEQHQLPKTCLWDGKQCSLSRRKDLCKFPFKHFPLGPLQTFPLSLSEHYPLAPSNISPCPPSNIFPLSSFKISLWGDKIDCHVIFVDWFVCDCLKRILSCRRMMLGSSTWPCILTTPGQPFAMWGLLSTPKSRNLNAVRLTLSLFLSLSLSLSLSFSLCAQGIPNRKNLPKIPFHDIRLVHRRLVCCRWYELHKEWNGGDAGVLLGTDSLLGDWGQECHHRWRIGR